MLKQYKEGTSGVYQNNNISVTAKRRDDGRWSSLGLSGFKTRSKSGFATEEAAVRYAGGDSPSWQAYCDDKFRVQAKLPAPQQVAQVEART